MEPLGDQVIAKNIEMEKTPNGVILPDGTHPYLLRILEAGPGVSSVDAGDIIVKRGNVMSIPYEDGYLYILQKHQIVARAIEEEIDKTCVLPGKREDDEGAKPNKGGGGKEEIWIPGN